MKKFSLIVSLILVALSAIPAAAQYSGGAPRPASATRSVLKQADRVEWADYHVGTVAGPGISGCPDAHVTCSTGVCHGYDNCCCRPHLLCCLKKIGRMLDCLLPCNKCCPGGCLFGGCGPHLFHGGCCGGRNIGCSTPSCSSPIGYPGAGDPFIDDPVPPQPMPEPAKDVRYRTKASPYAARQVSPYKVTTSGEVSRQRAIEASRREVAPVAAPVTTPYNPRDKVAIVPRERRQSDLMSALQRVAAEEEIGNEITAEEITAEPARRDQAPAPPALLPVTIQRTSAELPADDLEIPLNPLRK
jgi:hypothetical protein